MHAALVVVFGGVVVDVVGFGAVVVVVVRGDRLDRLEVGLAALSLALTVGLSLWRFTLSNVR